jgi:hypothetical protein
MEKLQEKSINISDLNLQSHVVKSFRLAYVFSAGKSINPIHMLSAIKHVTPLSEAYKKFSSLVSFKGQTYSYCTEFYIYILYFNPVLEI